MNGNDLVEHIESCENCMDLADAVDKLKDLFGYEVYNKEKNGDKLNKLISDLEMFACDVELNCLTDTLASIGDDLLDAEKEKGIEALEVDNDNLGCNDGDIDEDNK